MRIFFKKLMRYFSNLFKISDNKVSHIYYHQVVNEGGNSFQKINVQRFKEQMQYLKNQGYNTLLFNENNLNDSKNVCISFDDGYLDNYEIVFPIMKELNLKFNIFLETNAIENRHGYLSWSMIKEMKESGLVGFGVHTHTHIDARFINKGNINQEINLPNSIIEKEIGIIPMDFCFPFGAYNCATLRYFTKYSPYKRLYTSDGNSSKKYNNVDIIGRIGIEASDSIKEFNIKLRGGYDKYYFYNYLFKRIFVMNENNEYKKYR